MNDEAYVTHQLTYIIFQTDQSVIPREQFSLTLHLF